MNYWNAYLTTFSFLEEYLKILNNNDLAMLLGTMNPYILSNNKPVDKSIVRDWIEVFNIEKNKSSNTNEDVRIFRSMLLFLQKQERNFGLKLIDVVSPLNKAVNQKFNNNHLWTEWSTIYTYWKNQPDYDLGNSIPTYPI